MKIQRTVLYTALIGVSATLTLSACGDDETPAVTIPTTSTSSAPAATTPTTTAPNKPTTEPAPIRSTSTKPPAAEGVLSGKRQVVIKPVPSFESVLALDAKGRLGLTDGESDRSLFVFTPDGQQFLIKTAKTDASGEPSCLSVQTNGSSSLTVVAAACDASAAAQKFEVTARGKAYAISNRSAFLQVVESGLIAEELGDAPLRTTFDLVDNGEASLPALD